MKDKGIVIVATKHPYYGRMAYNLAVSIKAVENFPVCVLHSNRGIAHLSERQRLIFDDIIEIDTSGISSKLSIYKKSPYRRTLYIDADNAWFPKQMPSKLFDELDGVPFAGITEGCYDIETGENNLNKEYYLWAEPGEMIRKYNLESGKIFQWRTEFIYFEKSDLVEAMFEMAEEIIANPGIEVTQFAGTVPDELAINIACAVYGIEPHIYKWQPCFWDRTNGKFERIRKHSELYEKFYAMSTGGNRPSSQAQALYTRIMKAAFHKMGLQYLFPLQSKVSVIDERKKM